MTINRPVSATFTVTITADADVWKLNYMGGVDSTVPDRAVQADVADYFERFLNHAVDEHIRATGNTGTVGITTVATT